MHKFKKQYGQNFLRHARFARELVHAAKITPEDVVIEIGPGDGKVTQELLAAAAKVIAIEVDYDLIVKLIKRFNEEPNFEIVHQDVLTVDIAQLLTEFQVTGTYKIVGSLPYNIYKQIIQKFVTAAQPPASITVIVQEEVANNYAATAPKADYLGNWIRLYADVKKGLSIPKGHFFPAPKVNGAILNIIMHQDAQFTEDERGRIEQLLRIGFSRPRKTLRNNLRSLAEISAEKLDQALASTGLDKQRASEVTLEQWQKLAIQLL